MKKVLFTTSSFDLANLCHRAELEAAGYEFVLNPVGKRLTEQQLEEMIDDNVVGIVAGLEPLTHHIFEKASGLKVVARCGIGMDNVDLPAAIDHGISVFNTPDAPTRSVAELTMAHILSLARRIPESDRNVRNRDWRPLMGSLLSEQTVGVIGCGRIGSTVVRLLQAFEPRILVSDVAGARGRRDVEFVSLPQLLKGSDIVTLHVPYEAETRHLINAERLALMKPGSLLVNVARGGLIDEEAVVAALRNGQLGGVALDCCEVEPYCGPLAEFHNVQFTAHMGSYAKEARALMEAEACRTLVAGLRQHGLL